MKYDTVEDGDLVRPPMRGWREMCCDCGLVHRINFSIVVIDKKGRAHKATPAAKGSRLAVQFRVHRDKRATAAARRRKQVKR